MLRDAAAQELKTLLGRLRTPGFQKDYALYAFILQQCSVSRALVVGKLVHGQLLKNIHEKNVYLSNLVIGMYSKCGALNYVNMVFENMLQPNVFSWTILLSAYVQCGQVKNAHRLFNAMPERNVVSWTTIIAAYAKYGYYSEALGVFEQMLVNGESPNIITMVTVLGACSSLKDLIRGKIVHARILHSKFNCEVIVMNALVYMYGKSGSLKDSECTFKIVLERTVVSWATMINAYIENGHVAKALHLFQEMKMQDAVPDHAIFLSILSALAIEINIVEAKRIHSIIIKRQLESDPSIGTTLVDMYGTWGHLSSAQIIFNAMVTRDVLSWTALIAAFTHHGHGKEALLIFQEMDIEDLVPDKVILTTILTACANEASLTEGKRVHDLVIQKHLQSDILMQTALVNMYNSCGIVENARIIFNQMFQKDVISWNSMLAAYSQHGNSKEVFRLFHFMVMDGIWPSQGTFTSILSVCGHAGLLDKESHYFSYANDYCITPCREQYHCMIDLFSRTGWLDEAKSIIGNMPFQANVVSWTTLLEGCKANGGTVQRGQGFDLPPEDVTSSLLTSDFLDALHEQEIKN